MENKNLTFEQANELLEKTVSKMESGELTLEQTMEEYAKACEEGGKLCRKDVYEGWDRDIQKKLGTLIHGYKRKEEHLDF